MSFLWFLVTVEICAGFLDMMRSYSTVTKIMMSTLSSNSSLCCRATVAMYMKTLVGVSVRCLLYAAVGIPFFRHTALGTIEVLSAIEHRGEGTVQGEKKGSV